ncbi:MAG TPA: choice-of-anchor Q domain-containing protein, partial [Polyangiaceae bacterium]|nr:choice-of-anchor Q domain-containing protein [Polyangiaceae bacterium]
GAIAGDSSVTVSGGSFDANSAEGGLSRGRGGAIAGVGLVLEDAQFTNNVARGEGGAAFGFSLDADAVTADGNEAGGKGGGAFAIVLTARLTGSRVTNNAVASQVEYPTEARGAGGGGIRVGNELTLVDSVLLGNSGKIQIWYFGPLPVAFAGGGIHAGSVRGTRVTLANNLATGPTTAPAVPESIQGVTGGGAVSARGTVWLTNATLVGNRLGSVGPIGSEFLANRGAAVMAHRLELQHATIAENTGAETLELAELASSGSVVIAPASDTSAPAACASGVVSDESSFDNWFSDASCGLPQNETNEQAPAAFLLGALVDNGGPVPTALPAAGSVLIDRIPPERCSVPVDARGVERPQGEGCDIGAVEQ